MRSGGLVLWVALALLGAVRPAAADAVFTDEAEFLAAAGSTVFESFEGLEANDAVRQNAVETPGFTVTTDRRELGIFGTPISGLHATHGSNHLVWDAYRGGLVFTFATPITAFGVTLNDALDQGADPRLSLDIRRGPDFPDFLVGPLEDANERFFGVVTDAPFTRLTITHNTRESVGLDGVHYAPVAQPDGPPAEAAEPAEADDEQP